jgi:hypothetical protein
MSENVILGEFHTIMYASLLVLLSRNLLSDLRCMESHDDLLRARYNCFLPPVKVAVQFLTGHDNFLKQAKELIATGLGEQQCSPAPSSFDSSVFGTAR